MQFYVRARYHGPRTVFWVAGLFVALFAGSAATHAHHAGHRLSAPSPSCGWIDGEDGRDRRNLAEFCARWIPAEFRVRSASANQERLWIDAPAELVTALRDNDRATAVLLRDWLKQWQQTTGFKTASVILVREHTEVARIQTTMAGDVVRVR